MEIKNRIYFLFHVIYGIFLLLFGACVFHIVKIQYIEKNTWEEISKTIKTTNKPKKTEPVRGKIYCYNSNGEKEMVAASLKTYKIYFDGAQLHNIEKDLREKKKRFSRVDSINTLAQKLSEFYNDAPPSHYKNLINSAYSRKKQVLLNSKNVDYVQRKQLIKFPLFNSARGKYVDCLRSEEVNHRIHPFGDLAKRTIGDVYSNRSHAKDGMFGVELQFDSLLRGKEGLSNPLKISKLKTVYEEQVKSIDGADITLTLNIDMQDIVSSSLKRQAEKLRIERGCAILMEVATGEIKAMVNISPTANGEYRELQNMAISDMNPPGSTFKIASMLVALENNIVTADTIVNALDTKYKRVTDHAPKPNWNAITASDVLVFSSNVGTANIIAGAYENKPMEYIRSLQKTKINKPFDIQLPGAAKATIDTVNRTDLPSMSFGYQVVVPPIYMLRFYNAIANSGKMVNPMIIKEIDNNGEVKKFPTEVVTSSICSQSTVKSLQNMLRNVVEQKGGTGYSYRSKIVSFAGKTGTAVFKIRGKETDQVSFCGYFPADNPKYSCIVVMDRRGLWGTQSCEVFKEIAEKIMSLNHDIKLDTIRIDSVISPHIKHGKSKQIKSLAGKLGIKSKFAKAEWLTNKIDSTGTKLNFEELRIIENLVPNVVGMGAKDAVFLLEKNGLQVKVMGVGTVRQQSQQAGSKILKGSEIIVYLN